MVAPEKQKSNENMGDDPATSKPFEKADTLTEPIETDFAAALKMIAMLPLSDADKAEAVRRLLVSVDNNGRR